MPANIIIFAGSLLAGLSVLLSAFGAHYLKNILPTDALEIFKTATNYQMYHAIALIIVGILSTNLDKPQLKIAAWLFIGGTILFSGSLYALTFTKIKAIGLLTPIGGIMFIAGWILLALSAL